LSRLRVGYVGHSTVNDALAVENAHSRR